MSGGGGAVPRKTLTLDDLIEAMDKCERAPRNVPKVDTFHFKGERVSDWLDLVDHALVGLADEVRFQRIMRYVLHSYHQEVSKVVDAANGSWSRFREGMLRKYRLGDGLLTMADLEAMNKDDFSTIGAFVHELKKKARKVHGISEEAQCAIFLGLLTGTEASELTSHGGGSEKLTWATIDKGVEEGSLDQVEQHQMRLQRRKRKERDATASGTPGVKRIVTDTPHLTWKSATVGADQEPEQGGGASQEPSQAPPRKEPESGRRKEVVEVSEEDEEDDDEEDERLRQEEDRRTELRAKERGAQEEAEPSLPDSVPKKKKYAVRLEEGFDVKRMVDRLLEGHNDLMNLKDILASAPRLRDGLKGSGRNKLNLGSFTFEESENEQRRLWEVPEEEGGTEVLTLSLTDVNKAMEVVAAYDMADPEAIKALREQVLEIPQVGEVELVYRLPSGRGGPAMAQARTDKNRADGLSRINWDGSDQESIRDTSPIDGFFDQEEDVRLHINERSLWVPSCVGHHIWLAPKGYEQKEELVLKPFQEEDPWGSKDVHWMMKLALAGTHSLAEEVRTIEEGPTQVEEHEQLMGGMYLLTNTLLQGDFDRKNSFSRMESEDFIPESRDNEFEEGEIKEAFRAEEYDGIYLELGLLLSCEMRDRDASVKAQKIRHLYVVRDDHLSDFSKTAMQRGGRGGWPRQRPLGASGGGGQRRPVGRESTPVFDDDNVELFLGAYQAHAAREGWSTQDRVRNLRGVRRFEEPIAHIRAEALTWQDVEARMQRLRASPLVRDGLPIRLEEGNAEEFIPAYKQYMRDQGTGQEEWMQTLPLWTRRAERPLARQIRDRARDWEDCHAQLRQAFRQPEPERPESRVERRQRSKRPRDSEAREAAATRGGRKALAWREEGPAEPVQVAAPVQAAEPVQTAQPVQAAGPAQMGVDPVEPVRYEPAEEPPGPEPEAEPHESGELRTEEVITVGDDTPPPTPIPEQVRQYWPEGIPEPDSKEIPVPPSEIITPPLKQVEPEEREESERARTHTILAPPLAEHAAKHLDTKAPTSKEPPSELLSVEGRMSAGVPLREAHETQTERQSGETAEEKFARVQVRLEEIYERKVRMEAAAEVSTPPIDPGTRQEDERVDEARETGDLGFQPPGWQSRIRQAATTSFQRYTMLSDELAASRMEVEQLSVQLAEERAENQAWRSQPPQQEGMKKVFLDPVEAEARRKAQEKSFSFRVPTELASQQVTPMTIETPAEEPAQRPQSPPAGGGSAEKSPTILLEVWGGTLTGAVVAAETKTME
ncbi:hypothetical protein CBR_g28728 [Chara braunii]|uniref:Uncharacterized protein n=1 Tax=Chara braunii TaxID=69332 RepID=A0A388L9M7_CHABU|nr:hypothetical protein CBR_g28728 [Chara braunii]|eukprot:GBG79015.1 hypothetical protein CBR_g28728 [Chara braunii]